MVMINKAKKEVSAEEMRKIVDRWLENLIKFDDIKFDENDDKQLFTMAQILSWYMFRFDMPMEINYLLPSFINIFDDEKLRKRAWNILIKENYDDEDEAKMAIHLEEIIYIDWRKGLK